MPVAQPQRWRPQGRVLGLAALHTVAPQAESAGLQLPAHQGDDGGFIQFELHPDRLERRAVLPGHLDDPGHIGGSERNGGLGHGAC